MQRHFLAALMIVTGQGVTVGVRRMHTEHAQVHDRRGEPITDATWNTVIGTLAGVLAELGTPPATLGRAGHHHRPDPRRHRRRPRPGRLRHAHPTRFVIDQHGNEDGHTCRSCGLSWPCFDLGTAIAALDLVIRVHYAARRQPRPDQQHGPQQLPATPPPDPAAYRRS